MPSLSVLILAAGKGVRMRSALPKVLHPVNGIPMIERVLTSLLPLKPSSIGVVVGYQAKEVQAFVSKKASRLKFFRQPVMNGSGGAVRQAANWIKKQNGDVLIACGDAPLFRTETLDRLLKVHRQEGNLVTVLTTEVDSPFGYGRIVRSGNGRVMKIIEELDASPGQRQIKEINTGTYCFNAKALASALPELENDNQKKEYYLTDAVEILAGVGRAGAMVCADSNEAWGINRRSDLARAQSVLYRRKLDTLMDAGVTIIDPASTFIDEEVSIQADTVIYPQVFVKGKTKIGARCQIGPWSHITNCVVENDVTIQASFTEDSIIRARAKVGPFSRVRPGSDIGRGVHLGNFSEVKKSKIGEGSKVNHLSYLGDATLGKNVNIGAGVITCNYDGIKKSPTSIQDHAFIGSNVNLVAPVRVGKHAVVGAGSTIGSDVPDWALSVERAPLVIKKGWAKNKFKKKRK